MSDENDPKRQIEDVKLVILALVIAAGGGLATWLWLVSGGV